MLNFYGKKLSKFGFKSISGFSQSNRIVFPFNNLSLHTNSYSFDYKSNSMFPGSSELNKEYLEKLLKGVDRKIELVEDVKIDKYLIEATINNHYRLFAYSSLNQILHQFFKIKEASDSSEQQFERANENHITLIISSILEKPKEERSKLLSSLRTELVSFLAILEELREINQLKLIVITKKVESLKNFYINLAVIVAAIWCLTFYALIFHLYSWDVIEPTTYLAGNLVLILQLIFFIRTKRRPVLDYLSSKHFLSKLNLAESKNLNFSKMLDSQIADEIRKANVCLDFIESCSDNKDSPSIEANNHI